MTGITITYIARHKENGRYSMLSGTIKSQLCNAIKDRKIVTFRYQHEHQMFKQRTFKPHVLHVSSKDNLLISGYQQPYQRKDWRHFDASKIDSLVVTGNGFEPSRDFSSFTDKYSDVICAIDR